MSSATKCYSPHLQELGLDVLHAICGQLCYHCCQTAPSVESSTDRCTLISLSLTSRSLRAVAQQYLYHSVIEIPSYIGLVQTLAVRPDLASAVKWVRCSFHYHIEHSQLDYLKQLGREYHLDLHGDLNYNVLRQGGNEGIFALRELCAELLVALCPNVQALSFPLNADMGGCGMHSVARFLASRAQAVSPLALFHNLTHLTLDAEEYAMGSNLDVPVVALILNEAPNLANLRMIRIRPAVELR